MKGLLGGWHAVLLLPFIEWEGDNVFAFQPMIFLQLKQDSWNCSCKVSYQSSRC